MGILRQGFHAQQFQSQTVYAIEDAEEVRLVDDLPSEDRLSVFGLHLHPFEGHSVSVAEFASHHYAVDRSCTLAHHLSSSTSSSSRSGYSLTWKLSDAARATRSSSTSVVRIEASRRRNSGCSVPKSSATCWCRLSRTLVKSSTSPG